MIRHIVTLNYKDGFSPEENKANALQVKQKLEALVDVIPGMNSFIVYTNALSSSNKDLCMYTLFESEPSLAAYQIHPAHTEVAAYVASVMQNRVCVDYIVANESIAAAMQNTAKVRHIVSWQYKPGFTDAENKANAAAVKQRLEALKSNISGILSLTVETKLCPSSSHNIVLNSVFESEDALAAYQVHPAHIEVSNFVGTVMCGRACVDFMEI